MSLAVDIVIFGATGDLAMRKLFPALYYIHREGQLADCCRIVAVSRDDMRTDQFQTLLNNTAKGFVRTQNVDADNWSAFQQRVSYCQVDVTSEADFQHLADALPDEGDRVRVFYLSIGPSLFSATCEGLAKVGLVTPNSRLVAEKPLGRDLHSSRDINRKLGDVFNESQIYRIDHYLGKETVQNLFALRFGNSLFEPLWQRGQVKDVQITVAETLGIGRRGEFYDRTGALRDMVQNHLLQLLCIIAMEPPTSLDGDAVRDEKRKVLRGLRPLSGEAALQHTVRGQYRAGAIEGQPVVGYLDEKGVATDSRTETFVAIRAYIDTWRWAGVPFFLRTGKRLQRKLTQIVVNFHPTPHNIFAPGTRRLVPQTPNKLVIRLQPDEGISLQIMAKTPGDQMRLQSVNLNLDFNDSFESRQLDAYERLLMDAIRGNLTLFMRRDELDAAWGWVDPILSAWDELGQAPRPYVSGTWGPSTASSLLLKGDYVWNEEL